MPSIKATTKANTPHIAFANLTITQIPLYNKYCFKSHSTAFSQESLQNTKKMHQEKQIVTIITRN
ncbi:hypothetical protein [Helicobacter colisuis]|uniref:hypothetical protein n=1 Tax=Helicobacter colisuis TaxID=2949739 RepID=UPI00202A12E9|nr:hypothetical protein [Helicobacter colisuis]MCL9822344.1 hypothetical protein [Helicobacter colisuis]